MNNAMVGGVARHLITLLAGAIILSGTGTLDDAVKSLMNALASGDINSIIGTVLVIGAILWSTWVKMTEASKQVVINTLTFKSFRK